MKGVHRETISRRVFLVLVFILLPILAIAGVSTTKHNLSVSGPGPTSAVTETEVCIFCHTPHNSTPSYPLWNHELSSVEDYTSYWSPSLKSYASQEEAPPIDGFSKLCLSCHDGTVALGAVVTRDSIETVPDYLGMGMRGYLGTDLSGGHPISIIFDQALSIQRQETDLMHLNWPVRKFGDRQSSGDPDVLIYPTQGDYGVQCISCHDPHGGKGGPGAPPFWRKTTYDEVCEVCHVI